MKIRQANYPRSTTETTLATLKKFSGNRNKKALIRQITTASIALTAAKLRTLGFAQKIFNFFCGFFLPAITCLEPLTAEKLPTLGFSEKIFDYFWAKFGLERHLIVNLKLNELEMRAAPYSAALRFR